MGDPNASDCSWKKMVIAKANNEWTSMMKRKYSKIDSTLSITKIPGNLQLSIDAVKEEQGENDVNESYKTETPMSITQEIDPLAILQPIHTRRRRSSCASIRETSADRASRLAKMSAYSAHRLANETPQQRANRLKRMSEYAANRLAHESNDQRAQRLSRMSAYSAKRLASETAEQRKARLARMSAYAARRHAMKKDAGSNSADTPED